MPRMSWRQINEKIIACRLRGVSSDIISYLEDLYEETGDAMVAFALGEELEKAGNVAEAEKYYEEAEQRFPLPDFKKKAAQALERLSTKAILPVSRIIKPEAMPEGVSYPATDAGLLNYDPLAALFIVSCTKKKIWDRSSSAPEFVPARYAYIGDSFLRFVNWADDQQLERRGFKWMILSGKYGLIEPWHPISYYDIAIDEESHYPVTVDFLKNQVRQVRWVKNSQGRWEGYNISRYRQVICVNCSQSYKNKIMAAFSDSSIEEIEL